MSGLRLIASGDSLLNYNVAVAIVVQLYSCCYQFKCQICLTYPCANKSIYLTVVLLTVNIKFTGPNLYSLSCVSQLRNLNSNTGAHIGSVYILPHSAHLNLKDRTAF